MSEQIILSYKEKERKISIPSNYTDLKELFLSAFEEDEKSTLEKVSGKLKRTDNPMKNDFKLKLSGIKTVI